MGDDIMENKHQHLVEDVNTFLPMLIEKIKELKDPKNLETWAQEADAKEKAEILMEKMKELNVNATIRRRLGQDISAACGQLRNEHR